MCYYYFFIEDEFLITKIRINFNDFWKSINTETNTDQNINSFFVIPDSLISFDKFTSTLSSAPLSKEKLFNAKKIYFCLLMDIGGNSGFNKVLKKKILEDKFTYESCENWIRILKNRLNQYLLKSHPGDRDKHSESIRKLDKVLKDYHSAERNERKLLFIYGLFQGEYQKKEMNVFFSLTHIGKKVIDSTFSQLLLIWEHQKLKMISQPPVYDFSSIDKDLTLDYNKFGILFNPYIKILEVLNQQKSFTFDEYKYIISKIKDDDFDYNVLSDNDKSQYIQRAKLDTYIRNKGNTDDDFGKELKKYLLGIFTYSLDRNNNYLSCIELDKNEYKINNVDKLTFLYKNYKLIGDYLNKEYKKLYKNSEEMLKKKYIAKVNTRSLSDINYDSIIYEWHKYIFNFDINLVLNMIYIHIAIKADKLNYKVTKKAIYDNLEEFKPFYEMTGIKNKKVITEKLKKIEKNLKDGKINQFNYDKKTKNYKFLIITNRNLPELEKNMKRISKKQTKSVNPDRSEELSKTIRSYYIGKFSDSSTHLIKCDSCKETTFLTEVEDGQISYAHLEFHHLIPLKENGAEGPDHYLNLFGVCSNCHNKFHKIINSDKRKLYEDLSNNNNFGDAYSIVKRIKKLKKENAIIPLHLEYLKKEFIITNYEYKQLNKKD
ncbi:HNH endonuclease [Sulfurimonas sp. CS5]|uniref:HNH endonuclease n=1 Tax=Sulfurimonas sp. CS5 TaxID=3391145 RepID=UPI0039EA96EF